MVLSNADADPKVSRFSDADFTPFLDVIDVPKRKSSSSRIPPTAGPKLKFSVLLRLFFPDDEDENNDDDD